MLLCTENVNQDNLLSYAREAADFATNYQLPSLDFAINHNGQPDVAMFDFTSMYASENAALMRERQAHQLLVALVGDSLLEVLAALRALHSCHGSDLHICTQARRLCCQHPRKGRFSDNGQTSAKAMLAWEPALLAEF